MAVQQTKPNALLDDVLIVEDNADHAYLLQKDLASLGVNDPRTVDSFDAAHAACAERTPSLVLADFDLKNTETGYDIACSLWTLFGVPTILTTSMSASTVLTGDTPAGVVGFISKPFSLEQLDAGLRLAASNLKHLSARDDSIEELRDRLEERKLIEHAKWRLVSSRGMTAPAAPLYMQNLAREHRRKIIDVAFDVIADLKSSA